MATAIQHTAPTLDEVYPAQGRIQVVVALSPERGRPGLEAILGRTRWQVTWCDPAVIEQEARRHPGAVVLCDGAVPRAALLNLIADDRTVVLATAGDDRRVWASAINAGAFDVLPKPYDPEEVLWTLSAAWHHRAGNQRRYRHARA